MIKKQIRLQWRRSWGLDGPWKDLWDIEEEEREQEERLERHKRLEKLQRIREANDYIDEMFERFIAPRVFKHLEFSIIATRVQKVSKLEEVLDKGYLLQMRARVPGRIIRMAYESKKRQSNVEDVESSTDKTATDSPQGRVCYRRGDGAKTILVRRTN
jgi:hypothetical protein